MFKKYYFLKDFIMTNKLCNYCKNHNLVAGNIDYGEDVCESCGSDLTSIFKELGFDNNNKNNEKIYLSQLTTNDVRLNKILVCNDCYDENLTLKSLKLKYPNNYDSLNCVTCGNNLTNILLKSVTKNLSYFLQTFDCDYELMVIKFYKFLVYNNIDFNMKFEFDNTLLHHACKSCDLEIIKLLLKAININTLNSNNENCLHYLLNNYHDPILKIRNRDLLQERINNKYNCINYLYNNINKKQYCINGNNYLQTFLQSEYFKSERNFLWFQQIFPFNKIINVLIKTDLFHRNNHNLMIVDVACKVGQFTIANKIQDLMNNYYKILLDKKLCPELSDLIISYMYINVNTFSDKIRLIDEDGYVYHRGCSIS